MADSIVKYSGFVVGFFLIRFPVKVRKLHYFVICRFSVAWEGSLHMETFIFMVSISLPITKCSVTHNKVMNIQKFWEYMLKSSKRGPHARKMKSWILCRLRSTQKYPHFEDFFIDQRRLKFRIFYHISAPCVLISQVTQALWYYHSTVPLKLRCLYWVKIPS